MLEKRLLHIVLALPLFLLPACGSLIGGRTSQFVCSYDTVWETAVDTMKSYSITSLDKDNGAIETAWIEMDGKKRPYGVFRREGFGNLERARMAIAVKKINDVTSINVLEIRQRWHARGGASSQAAKWWPVEPSEEVMEEVTDNLTVRLKEKGCEVSL